MNELLLRSPLWQLFVFRLRVLWREPSVTFWIFGFPLLLSIGLGIAYRTQPPPPVHIAVVGADASDPVQSLRKDPGVLFEALSLDEARTELERGRVALVYIAGHPGKFLSDPAEARGREAQLLVERAETRPVGGPELRIPEQPVEASSARYIEFLIPGMIGFGMMQSGFFGFGWQLVQMRHGKLLKRFSATPMTKTDFLFSFLLARIVLGIAELGFLLFASWLFFDVHVRGNVVGLCVFALLGATAFASIALLIAGRAKTLESASGQLTALSYPLVLFSGVFFSSSLFPQWAQPFIQFLPLTTLNEGLRAIMNDGQTLLQIGPKLLAMAVWSLVAFVAAVRSFRWV